MSAATILSEAYGESACLYTTVLQVPKNATPSQLRKAYYKKCLKYHPDKQTSSQNKSEIALAKKKFQAISLAYTILSDEEKRKEYDESGDMVEEDDDLVNKSGMKQWTEYFNSIFPKVTTTDIEAFEVKYKCSDEEESDVLKYYTQFKGDLNKMLECVMLSADVDKERWVKDYIQPAIDRGDVDDYGEMVRKTLVGGVVKKRKSKGRSSSSGGGGGGGRKRKKKVEVEVVESSDSGGESDTPMAEIVDDDDDDDDDEQYEEEKPVKRNNKSKKKSSSKPSAKRKPSKKKASSTSTDDDLIAAIRGKSLARREAGFDSLMAGLEDRYGGGGSGNKKKGKRNKKMDGDIDDDEFEKIQAKLMKNKRK